MFHKAKKVAEPDPAVEYRRRAEEKRRRLRKAGIPEPLLEDVPLPAGPVRKERAVFESRAEQLFHIELHRERIRRNEETFDTALERAARLRALANEAEERVRELEAWIGVLQTPARELETETALRAEAIRGAVLPLWEGYHRLLDYARSVRRRCEREARTAEARARRKKQRFKPSVKV